MRISWKCLLIVSTCLHCVWQASALAQGHPPRDAVELFRDADADKASRGIDTAAATGATRIIALDTGAMAAMQGGDKARIVTPSGTAYTLTYERTEAGYDGGKVWVGYLTDFGKSYPVLISTYRGKVDGTIATPQGKHRLRGDVQHAQLIDARAAGEEEVVPSVDDELVPPGQQVGAPAGGVGPAPVVASAGPAQIDVLELYTPGFASALGGDSAAIARVNVLIATSNNVYINSGINVMLRAVAVTSFSYADANGKTNSTALREITGVDSSGNPTPNSTSTAIAALRDNSGADMVNMLRVYYSNDPSCGLAWLDDPSQDAIGAYAFSLVSDVRSSGAAACDGGATSAGDTAPTHELGHNMGAAHDLYTTTAAGLGHGSPDGNPAYNRGYCNGSAGTVMAYSSSPGCAPIVPYFSNPALPASCNGGSCGVPIGTTYSVNVSGTTYSATGADSATAINANAPYIAAYRASAASYTVTPSAGANGSISPNTPQPVSGGARATFTVAANGGYVASVGGTCGGYLSGTTYTTNPVSGNCTVIASFSLPAGFVSINPVRLLDTRAIGSTVDGQFAAGGALGAGAKLDLTIAGRGGMPASAISAVVLNVTATGSTTGGYVSVWPSGSAQPLASNLNFSAGQTIANTVIAKLGTNGKVSLYNSSGNTQLIADVAGYFGSAADLVPLSPGRLLDTRAIGSTVDNQFKGGGALGPGVRLDLTVAGRYGIPASGVGAAILNVTAVQPSAPGYLTLWPSGTAQPVASNLNFMPGDVVPNLVIGKLGGAGKIAIFNSAGQTDVIADVAGWFPTASQLTPLQPARLMDTRPGFDTIDHAFAGIGALAGGSTTNLTVSNRGGVPASGVDSVVLNVTVTGPTAPGYLTVWPSGSGQPLASNINFVAGQSIPNLVIAKVGAGGKVALYVGSAGSTQVVVDVVGWFAGQ